MRRLGIFSILTLAFGLGACGKKPVDTKKWAVVTKQDVVQKISLNGTIRGLRQSLIQPGYTGYIGKLYVSVGDKVKEGQPLVRITQTIDQPLAEVFAIRAPFTGTITQILKRDGEYVSQGTDASSTLMVINDLREMWIDASVPEVDVAKISIGLEAQIRANALPGKRFAGVVRTLSLSPKQSQDRWDRGRVEYPTEIKITDPDSSLRPGMTVVVDVISAKVEDVLTLRHEFIHKSDAGFYVVDEAGAKHSVKTGISNEEVVEILSGVGLGLKVQMMDFGKL